MQLIPTYLPVLIIKSTTNNPDSMADNHLSTSTSDLVGRMYSHFNKLYELMKGAKENSSGKEDLKRNYNRGV